MLDARTRSRAGFTLLELMIVVVLVAVLAAIAIPAFSGYFQRSRTTEAFQMLGEIRQRQEAYRVEFGRYCGDLGWNPTAYGSATEFQPWNTSDADWAQLGVSPDSLLRFQYRVDVGVPGETRDEVGINGRDFWFVVQAQGDLDRDGDLVGFETYSGWRHVFVSAGLTDTPLSAGWE